MKVFLLLFMALLLGYKKNEPAPADPVSKLPPATQTGANTFGCLLNGQPWLPTYSFTGLTGPFRVTYDTNYLGGALQIKVNRYSGLDSNVFQALTFGAAYVDKVGVYQFLFNGVNGVFYSDTSNNSLCGRYGDSGTSIYQTGTLIST